MSTNLEALIRDALRDRATATQPSLIAPLRSSRRRVWLPPLIAATAVLALAIAIALAVRSQPDDKARPAVTPHSLVGSEWKVVQVFDGNGSVNLSSVSATIDFLPDGSIYGDAYETVDSPAILGAVPFGGFYEVVDGGFAIHGGYPGSSDVAGPDYGLSERLSRLAGDVQRVFVSAPTSSGRGYDSTPATADEPVSATVRTSRSGDLWILETAGRALTIEREGAATRPRFRSEISVDPAGPGFFSDFPESLRPRSSPPSTPAR